MAGEVIRLTGDKELIKKLSQLNSKLQRRVARGAVNAAISPWIKGMKSRINIDHKEVRLSIGRLRGGKTYKNTGVVIGLVGPQVYTKGFRDRKGNTISSTDVAKRAKILEFGTGKQSPRPFVRPTFQALKSQSISILFNEVSSRIDKEVAKLRK